MKLKDIIKYLFLVIFLIAISIFCGLKLRWDLERNIKLLWTWIGFFALGINGFLLSILIFRLFFLKRTETDLTYSSFLFAHLLKAKIGKNQANKFRILMGITQIIFVTSFILSFYYFIKIYETNQLRNYGKIMKIEVKDIHYTQKGLPYAYFEYLFNGKKYFNELELKNLKLRDSSVIIFSTKNPKIASWLDDLKKE